jgi:hypothetical protein
MTRRVGLRTLLLTALVLCAAPVAAQATPQPPVSVGARVRLWAPAPEHRDGWLVGTVVDVDRDAVEIREARSGRVWNIPFAGARLEVSRGMQTARYGAAAGAIGGFLLGEVAGFLLVRPAGGKSADPGTRTFERLRSAPVLLIGAGGAIAGFFLGRGARGERWDPVPLETDPSSMP